MGPQGLQGQTGPQGVQGPTGIPGPIAGSDRQLIYNDAGNAAGADVYYNPTNSCLGIGTSTPTSLFTLHGDDTDIFLDMNSTGTASMAEILFGLDGLDQARLYYTKTNNNLSLLWDRRNTGVGDLVFKKYASDFMTIKNDGKIGIGVSSPNSLLSLAGATQGNAIAFEPYTYFGSEYSSAASMLGHFVRPIVGAPGYEKSTAVSGAPTLLRMNNSGFWFSSQAVNTDPEGTVFNPDTNAKMVILNAGNVGIGTITPSSRLSILEPGESTTQSVFRQYLTNAGLNIVTDYTGNAYTPGVFWSTSNDNPTKPKAGIYLLETSGGTSFFFGTSNNYSVGITNDAMIIDPSGNVGLGAINPTYRLYVAGTAYSTGGWQGSDRRWKKNILPITDALDKVRLLKGITFEWNGEKYPEMGFSEGVHLGFIAQDVEQIIPELVKTDENGYKAVAYDNITALLVEALKQQDEKILRLETEIKALKELLESTITK